jgi:NADH:ubiquinone oxidoreductase subunit 6 (subunit J)
MELIAFYFFSTIVLLGAIFILITRNLMYSVFSLFLCFVGVAALFVLSRADFLAVAQLMIYVGGILILLVFGVMLTRPKLRSEDNTYANYVEADNGRRLWAGGVGLILFFLLLSVIFQGNFISTEQHITAKSTIQTLGVELMTSHLLPFEIAAVLLLIALVGAAYLALHREPEHK